MKSPTVQVGPPNGSGATSSAHPPDTGATRGARNHATSPTNTRPNLSDQQEPQPRPQVENNRTGTRPARQAARKTGPPPGKELRPTGPPPTNGPHRPTGGRPEPRPAAHHAGGAGVKEGSKGNSPPRTTPPATREPGPTSRTPPPTRHPNLRTQPQPETRHRSRDPHHPPATPPSTPHQVPCIHAMGHIQPPSTLANKLEQNQETSSRKSKTQMRRPRPGHHPTTH